MLPVVDLRAGLLVVERKGPSAKEAALLDERDVVPAIHQGAGRREAGEPAAEDRYGARAGSGSIVLVHVLAMIRSFSRVLSAMRPSNTRKPLASMRSSTAL